MSDLVEGQLWRRKSDGVVFEVHYIGGGSYNWVDLRNLATQRTTTISAVGLRKKYDLVVSQNDLTPSD